MDLRAWQGIMVGYEAINQWRIYNPITKKVHISRDIRFDERYVYNSQLNDHNEEVGELWSPENNEQLALQEKELEEVITRRTDVVDSTTTKNNVRKYERLDTDDDGEFILLPLEEGKPLIPSELRSQPMTGFFPHEDDLDHYSTPKFQAQKSKSKAPALLLSNKETRSITGSSKPCFWYMNGTLFSHYYIHKVSTIFQFGNYLGLNKA